MELNSKQHAAMPLAEPMRLYPFLVGLLLGVLQSGLFFTLTFTLSSGFATYLLITLCWLIGGVAGAAYVKRLNLSLRLLLVIMLVAYALCATLVSSSPFNTHIWPLYSCLIGLAGIYPGVFFARASALYAARVLLFWENNGFITGLAITTMTFMLVGRGALWTLPALLAIVVWFLSPLTPNRTKQPVIKR